MRACEEKGKGRSAKGERADARDFARDALGATMSRSRGEWRRLVCARYRANTKVRHISGYRYADVRRERRGRASQFLAGMPILVDPRYAPDFPPTHPARQGHRMHPHPAVHPHVHARVHATSTRTHARARAYTYVRSLRASLSRACSVATHPRAHRTQRAHGRKLRVHADIVRADAYAQRDGERRTMATATAAVVQPGGAEYRRTDRCVPAARAKAADTDDRR